MNEKEATELLKMHSDSERALKAVLSHSKKVQEVALDIAKKIPGVDLEFVRSATIVHDIGRFKCPPWHNSSSHGLEGGKILRKYGLVKYARVAERHLGAGITKGDIAEQKLDLPKKDFVPETVEEKIITIADKLVDGNKRVPIKSSVERFKKEVSSKTANRISVLYDELMGLQSG